MASSSCVRLWCHRCTRSFVLHSKVACVASHYSAQVQQCSTAFRISSSTSSTGNAVTGFSAASGIHAAAPHARHRWKRLYSDDVSGKPLSAQARDNEENATEPWRANAVAAPYQNPSSSQRVSHVAPTATARETALHLDAWPQLPALEETRDEESISTTRPQLSVLLEESRDEEIISTTRPQLSVLLKETRDEEIISTTRPQLSVLLEESRDEEIVSTTRPQLPVLLKETRDEESISTTRPQLPVLLEESRDEEIISTTRPQEETRDEEDISIVVSSDLPPLTSQSLVDYVDKSETLSRLVQLGVNLRQLEQRPNVGTMLLRLDFQADVAPRLLFLRDMGVEESGLGRLLSHNPFILTESLENLHTRVNYLLSRKFSSQTVASMVVKAPYLLNFSVKRLDNRLAFFQQQLGLSPDNTRDVVARLPRLLCGSLEPIKETLKVCKVEFGFKENEVQHIILAVPKVLTANKKKLSQIFDYVHNTMHIPHHLIVKFPQVLNCKFLRVQERHLFLQYLSMAQYDPSQPGYVSLDRLAALPDDVFCSQVASATLDDFYLFQKTL